MTPVSYVSVDFWLRSVLTVTLLRLKKGLNCGERIANSSIKRFLYISVIKTLLCKALETAVYRGGASFLNGNALLSNRLSKQLNTGVHVNTSPCRSNIHIGP